MGHGWRSQARLIGAMKACWCPQAPDNPHLSLVFPMERWQDPSSAQWHMPGCFLTILLTPALLLQDVGSSLSPSTSHSKKGHGGHCLYSNLRRTSGKMAPVILCVQVFLRLSQGCCLSARSLHGLELGFLPFPVQTSEVPTVATAFLTTFD